MAWKRLHVMVARISTWLAGRRSAGSGLALLMTWGYFYGILRAYVPGSAGYFLFDAAVVCLYAARLAPGSQGFHRLPCQSLKAWVFVLCGWPLLLLFLPFQPFLISLVGLRAIVLPIPAILIGASLKHEDMSKLTLT